MNEDTLALMSEVYATRGYIVFRGGSYEIGQILRDLSVIDQPGMGGQVRRALPPLRIAAETTESDYIEQERLADAIRGCRSAVDLPARFNRFYRADDSRSRQAGGSGLGLSIAQWAVRVHGGDIHLLTAQGSGCTFRICLPPPVAPASDP